MRSLRAETIAVGGAALFGALVLLATEGLAAPPGTSVRYQGRLTQSGQPYNGVTAMELALFADEEGGAAVATRTLDPVVVTDGLFTVEVDFGAAAFAGEARWLEVRVGGIALAPRQKVTAAPYASFALAAPPGHSLDASDGSPASAVFVDGTGNVGVGTTTPGRRLDVTGTAAGARITNGAIAGPHLELKNTTTDTASHTVGSVDFVSRTDTRLGWISYVTSLVGDRLILGVTEADRVFVDQDGRVGIGTASPAVPLHVVGGTEASLAAGGFLTLGSAAGANLVMDANEIQARSDGTAADLFLNPAGGAVSVGNDLLVGGSIGLGLSSPAAPVHVVSGSDAEPTSGGMVVVGPVGGANLALDGNEIMARNNGAAATLYLNNDGGDIVCGGPVDIGYQIVSQSSSGASAQADCPAGKLAVAGGCDCGYDKVRKSIPVGGGTGWSCACDDDGVAATAICVSVK